ncbi:hypothetical protein vseg_010264 [Gypsophila vaccaria]
MDDDEEVHSHHDDDDVEEDDDYDHVVAEQSKQSDLNIVNDKVDNSLRSPPYSGGVTVAAPPSSSLTLALPIQQYLPRAAAAAAAAPGGGRDDCWSEGATAVLIEAWGERYMELSRGNLKQKHWKEVADIVNSNRDDFGKAPKTDIQCKNRIDTVKKKYKVEKSKVVSGAGPSRWPFFDKIDHLIGPSAAGKSVPGGGGVSVAGTASHEAVPVGIPFGIRQHVPLPLPFPSYGSNNQLRPPPHLQPSPQQPMPLRHVFPTPVRFHHNNNVDVRQQHMMLLQQQQQQLQQQFRRSAPPPPPPVESEEEGEGWSNESEDSLPPETGYERRKRPRAETKVGGGRGRKGKGKGKGKKGAKEWGNSVRELTRAILKFGEAYETAESAKLEHIVEMEKQRMKFAKELELQRMKFLMKTQLELSQFNDGVENRSENGNSDSRGGGSSGRKGGDGGGGGSRGGVENNHLH